MKFDAGRVVSLAESFNQPRAAGSHLSIRAGDHFETLMRDQGLATVHSNSSPRKRSIGTLLLTVLFLSSFFLTWRVIFPTRGIELGVSAIFYFLFELLSRLPAEPPSIIASAAEQDRAARVAIFTVITTPMSQSTVRVRKLLIVAAGSFGFVTLIPAVASALQHYYLISILFVLMHVFIMSMYVIFGSPFRNTKAYNGDNRTGIAMLVELARSLPSSVSSRMDALYVLSPSHLNINNILTTELADGKPTLLIILDAPGVGPANTIVGGEFAENTVHDLWLPDRYWFGVGGDGIEEVKIQGTHDDSPIDPAALERASQLITELSLRWSKQHS